jgi:trehalose 2-sulfotransferase
MRPHMSYLICCNPRTGSWLLAEGLYRTGVTGRPQEYFVGVYEQTWFERWGVSTYAEYVDKVIEVGTTPNGVFGAKAHWDQFQELPSRLRQIPGCEEMAMPELMSKMFPNLHYVWITRRDRVRQAISYYKAVQTDRWSSIEGWNYPETRDPTFDFEAIDFLLKLIVKNEEAWEQYFHKSGVKPLVVVYEDLEWDYEATIRQVLFDLHISLPANLMIIKPRLKKQADLVTEEWVQRYHDLKKAQSEI